MKKKLYLSIATLVLLFSSNKILSQTINLGILESFEGYTGESSITNAGTWIGDAGTNVGGFGGFGGPPTFIGNTYAANATTAQCRFDLFRLYIHLNALFVNYPDTHAAAFGAGEVLTPGVYSRSGAGSIGTNLTLDGGGNPNAFFVLKFAGAMTVGAGANVILTGGTQSCNVFYVADGSIAVAASANIKGTLFAKVGAIGLGAGAIVEGRMLTLSGAINTGVGSKVSPPPGKCTIPIFCETSCTPAPAVDVLGVVANYALYTNLGAVSNTAVSGINGNIGANSGSITGFADSIIIGSFNIANSSTSQASIDIENAYLSLMAIPNTVPSPQGVVPAIIAHSPVFGSIAAGGETITPGVYLINNNGALLNTLVLDGQNDSNSIFVFKFAGTFSVGANAKMILINGARRCNVFWIGGAGIASGAIDIGAGADVQGTFLSHGGAVGSGASCFIAGRQISTSGAIVTYGGIVYNNPECITSRSLNAPAIEAVADTPSALPGTNTPSVLANDTLNGQPAVVGTAAGQVTLTFTNSGPLTMNADGTITVAANTAAGTYSISYTICEVSTPTSCSTVTSKVTVTAAVILAVNDSYELDCNAGAILGTVLTNDTLNSISVLANKVTISLVSGANANVNLNTSNGELSIVNGIAFGEYTLVYKICENLNPANCSNGTINIKITQKAKPAIVDCSDTFTFVNCDWIKDSKLPVIR